MGARRTADAKAVIGGGWDGGGEHKTDVICSDWRRFGWVWRARERGTRVLGVLVGVLGHDVCTDVDMYEYCGIPFVGIRVRQAVPLGALCAPPRSHLGARWWAPEQTFHDALY